MVFASRSAGARPGKNEPGSRNPGWHFVHAFSPPPVADATVAISRFPRHRLVRAGLVSADGVLQPPAFQQAAGPRCGLDRSSRRVRPHTASRSTPPTTTCTFSGASGAYSRRSSGRPFWVCRLVCSWGGRKHFAIILSDSRNCPADSRSRLGTDRDLDFCGHCQPRSASRFSGLSRDAFYATVLNTMLGVESIDEVYFRAARCLGVKTASYFLPRRVSRRAAIYFHGAADRCRCRVVFAGGGRNDFRRIRARVFSSGISTF